MSNIVVEWHGQTEMAAKLNDLAARFPDRVGAALYYEGNLIMTRSKQDFVPVDLGALRDSGGVTRPEYGANGNISVTLYYGGAASAYALAIHEHPSQYDPPTWIGVEVTFHPPGHGPKYLERPFRDALAGMADRIAAQVKV